MAELRAVVPVSSAIIPREGADQQVTTLGPHAIATAAGSQGTFGGWTCTDAPSAGDVAFPTGTTTGAVTFGDAGSASTTVTFPGPGYYELTADIGGETETLGIYVTRPLPVIGTTLASGAGTAGGSVAPTLSDSGGADSVTYSTEVIQGSDASSVTVTGSTTSTPSWTNPTQDADGDSVMATSVATDAYGRTSKVSRVLDLAGTGTAADFTGPAALPDPLLVANDVGSLGSTSIGSFSATPSSFSISGTDDGGGAAPTMTQSGSGTGPYSVSIASGLANDTAYNYRVEATAADGQKAVVGVAVTVGSPNPISYVTDLNLDFTTDTATGSQSGAGSTTIYKADTVTAKATITNGHNSATGTWGSSWGTSDGVIFDPPSGGSAMAAITVDSSAWDMERDEWLMCMQLKITSAVNGAVFIGGAGTAANWNSGTQAGWRIDLGASAYTQATRNYFGGSATNGSNQNSVTTASNLYLTVQIRGGNGAMPTVVWRVDGSAPSMPTTKVDRDGVTWFGEHGGAAAVSAMTDWTARIPGTTIYANFGANATDTAGIALQKLTTHYLDVP